MSREFAELEALAKIVFEAEMAQLNTLSQEVNERRAALSELAEAKAARQTALADGRAIDDLAFLAGQDALWTAWLTLEGAQRSQSLAEAAARREDQRLKTQHAFGKRDALRQIREQDEAERAQMRARRASP